MDGACRAAFGLHFNHKGNCSPQIFPPFGRPLIRKLSHSRRGRDWINGNHFAETVGDTCCRFIPVDHNNRLFHLAPLETSYKKPGFFH
jgi:hypothetical protein